MFAELRETMINLVNEPDNRFENGSINWDFVHGDLYMFDWDVKLSEEQLSEWFDMIADEIEGL
jgi:hypothetical protein